MAIDSVRELLDREPFQPFRIRVSSGEAFEVRNPRFVVVMRSRIVVAKANSDRFSIIPRMQVVGIEIIPNGHPPTARRTKR